MTKNYVSQAGRFLLAQLVGCLAIAGAMVLGGSIIYLAYLAV